MATTFVVQPELGTRIWVWLLLVVAAGVVAAAKGRLGWVAVGVATGGLGFFVGAALLAMPDSVWARAFYGPAKMVRARARFPRRLPYAP